MFITIFKVVFSKDRMLFILAMNRSWDTKNLMWLCGSILVSDEDVFSYSERTNFEKLLYTILLFLMADVLGLKS